MDMHLTEEADEPIAETPEDVAILYSWANLHGARYRDFSASRREYRAQVRHRAAEETRQAELAAQQEAERAALEAERIVGEAEALSRRTEKPDGSQVRERAMRVAEDAGRQATFERLEVARRAEAAAAAEAAARREEREIAEAHASEQRQAARWHDSEMRRRTLAGPQPSSVPSMVRDPYEAAQGSTVDPTLPTYNRSLEYTQQKVYEQPRPHQDERQMKHDFRTFGQPESESRRPRGYKPDQPSGITPAHRRYASGVRLRTSSNAAIEPASRDFNPFGQDSAVHSLGTSLRESSTVERERRVPDIAQRTLAPAWLTEQAELPSSFASPHSSRSPSGSHSVSETLQQSREKVASRWFALKGLFDSVEGTGLHAQLRQETPHTPLLAVFSVAGGVGKTSLVATLGRALSSLGETVLLADTTSHRLLPYYFGATDLKPGLVRTFSPPAQRADCPIHLAGYDADQQELNTASQTSLVEQLIADSRLVQRMLIDFNLTSGWLLPRLPLQGETVLVPLAPDMSSVISLQSIEKYFQGAVRGEGRPISPFYLLNHFDASLPLHLDVREVLRRQLGERLLPFALRHSPAVSEALAEGMTVIDYQPQSGVTEDYLNMAKWLQSISAPTIISTRATRWSER